MTIYWENEITLTLSSGEYLNFRQEPKALIVLEMTDNLVMERILQKKIV